ncbi:MAG: PilZ domain-containing protein, partial [Myxococcota bacterium]|nr:PilZ domain-containing protein [Myxococcota bacterium]
MSEHALPAEGQLVTMVSVRDGDINVTSARVLVSKSKSLGLRIDTRLSDPAPFVRSQPLTLLYALDERVMRLKAVVSSPIDDERLTVRPVGDVKEGDRRDFRRADLTVDVYVRATDAASAEAARSAQLAEQVASDAFTQQTINLSGSGIQVSSKIDWASGTLLDIRIVLPLAQQTTVSVVGEVVRMLDIEDEFGRRVAVRFAEISEPDQDLIVYTVFSRH